MTQIKSWSRSLHKPSLRLPCCKALHSENFTKSVDDL